MMSSLGFVDGSGAVEGSEGRDGHQAAQDKPIKKYGSFDDLLGSGGLEVVEEAGRGGNGYVFKVEVTWMPDTFFGIKAIPRNYFNLESSMCSESEFVDKHRRLSTRFKRLGNVCMTHDISMDDEYFYIRMQWMDGGNCELPHRRSEDDARHIAKGALEGLANLHQHDITHCDVSLRNIMLKRNRASLVDLDAALLPGMRRHTAVWGTLNYTAPALRLRSCE
mmetsp:Transcript_30928/g.89942  ORF Transcript_30928/g.89942 Transcript_30928/m.89942 type:complete len:221 (+) Transcript_30928:247-909(+)